MGLDTNWLAGLDTFVIIKLFSRSNSKGCLCLIYICSMIKTNVVGDYKNRYVDQSQSEQQDGDYDYV